MFCQKNYCVNYARRLVYAPALPLLWSYIVKISIISIPEYSLTPPPALFVSSLFPHTSPLITNHLHLIPTPYPPPPPIPSLPPSLFISPTYILIPFPRPFYLLPNPSSLIPLPCPSSLLSILSILSSLIPLLRPSFLTPPSSPLLPHPSSLTRSPSPSSLTSPS